MSITICKYVELHLEVCGNVQSVNILFPLCARLFAYVCLFTYHHE